MRNEHPIEDLIDALRIEDKEGRKKQNLSGHGTTSKEDERGPVASTRRMRKLRLAMGETMLRSGEEPL